VLNSKEKHRFIFCQKKFKVGGCERERGKVLAVRCVKYEKSRWLSAKQKWTKDWRWEYLYAMLLARISKILMVEIVSGELLT
jgi:hypothetical protein